MHSVHHDIGDRILTLLIFIFLPEFQSLFSKGLNQQVEITKAFGNVKKSFLCNAVKDMSNQRVLS